MDELIGRKFRRNKYGLSLWTETINDVSIQWRIMYKGETPVNKNNFVELVKSSEFYCMEAKIKINRIYDLDEIVIYPRT